jgi:cytochrome P450
MSGTLDLATLRLVTPEVMTDPYPAYALLRDHDPVHWDDDLRGWVITRYSDVEAGLRDHGTFSSRRLNSLVARAGTEPSPAMERFLELASTWIWMIDPPEHTRVRKLMNQGFTPREIRRLEPLVEETVSSLVDDLLERGEFDLIPHFSYLVPALVLVALYGLPRADAPLVTSWCDTIKVFLGASPDMVASGSRAAQSLGDMMAYLTEQIRDRRTTPRDDFITRLVLADEAGDRLGDEELCSNLLLLIVATFETSVDLIGNGALALLTEQTQWARIKADPSLVPAAVEEILRYDGPVQLTHRLVTTDTHIQDQPIAAGELVYFVRGSANRDPRKFADADRLDVTRTETGHVALGLGVHYCIGAGLARIEGSAALRALITRMPDVHLLPDQPGRWRADNLQFRGLATLPAASGRA